MSLENIVEISTPFGYRSVELHHGDLSLLEFQVDALCISAFKLGYDPTPGTLIGSLSKNCKLDVSELAKAPHVDFREQMGVWLSKKLEGQQFNYLAAVEMLNYYGEGALPADSIRNLFSLLLIADLHDVEIRTVAMPLLGTGNQNIPPAEVLPPLMEMTDRVLQRAPLLHRVIFMATSEKKVKQLDEAMNQHLCRSSVDLQTIPGGQPADSIKAKLTASLRALHPQLGDLPSATETITTLILKMDSADARFFEIASLARRLAESLVLDLLEESQTDNLLGSIRTLQNRGSIARWIINYLHTLRIFGNEAAHVSNPGTTIPPEVDDKDVLSLLFCLNRVTDFWALHRSNMRNSTTK